MRITEFRRWARAELLLRGLVAGRGVINNVDMILCTRSYKPSGLSGRRNLCSKNNAHIIGKRSVNDTMVWTSIGHSL